MDASRAEFDFAHLLHSKLKNKHSKIETTIVDMRNWEATFYYEDMYQELKKFKDREYDLVVVRLGENIGQFSFNDHVYKDSLVTLCNFFKSVKTQVIITGTIENKPNIEEHQKLAAEALNCPFVNLDKIKNDYSLISTNKYHNNLYKQCPNDKGMEFIANSIFEKIKD